MDEKGQASLCRDEKRLLGAWRAMRIVFPARSRSEHGTGLVRRWFLRRPIEEIRR